MKTGSTERRRFGMKKDDPSESRRAAGEARWAGVSKRARSRQVKAIRANGGGRPRANGPCCWCGR